MTEDKCFYYSKFVIITGEKDRAKVFCMQNADFQEYSHLYWNFNDSKDTAYVLYNF